MSANIAEIDGGAAYAGRLSGWHLLGNATGHSMTWEEASKKARLDWPIIEQPVFSPHPKTHKQIELVGYKEIWRGNGDPYPLGTVGSDFEVVQNSQMFTFVDDLLKAHNGAHYETAGALGHGEKVWVLARIPGADINIKGTDDSTKTYLLVANGHIGNLSYTAGLTGIRVVCQNTLRLALSQAADMLRIRHTKNAVKRLADAKEVMANVVVDAQSLQEKLNALARRKMTKESAIAVINRVFGDVEEASARRSSIIEKVLELFESNDSNAIPKIRGSAYNMLNAVTEYVDHFRTSRITEGRKGLMNPDQARAQGALFGSGNKIKNEALVALMEETENAPAMTSKGVLSPMSDKEFLEGIGVTLD